MMTTSIKLKTAFLSIICLNVIFLSCKEDNIDRYPNFYVYSPRINESVKIKDSIKVEAVIDQDLVAVSSYWIRIQDANGDLLVNDIKSNNVKKLTPININESYKLDTVRQAQHIFQIGALLENGKEISQTFTFTFIK